MAWYKDGEEGRHIIQSREGMASYSQIAVISKT